MAVPYTFGAATAAIPLSQLDSNFATTITLGNTAIQLGNTVTTLNNMTLANVTVSSGSVTLTNIAVTTANLTTANIGTAVITGTSTLTGLTSSTALALDASKNIVSVTNTGSGNNVLGTSPTIATPTINTITSAAGTALTLQSNNGNTAVTYDTSQNATFVGYINAPNTFGFKNRLINAQLNINQRAVSGTVTLAAGAYGHDRFKGGASGCTYTFSTSNNVTTLTISAGSLIQVVEGLNLESGTYTLSWTGTVQGKIGAGSFSATGVTGSITGGTNTNIEFNTGTLSLPQLEKGSIATSFDYRPYGTELLLCQRYYETTSYPSATQDLTTVTTQICWNASYCTGTKFLVAKRATPTVTLYGRTGVAGAITSTASGTAIGGTSVASSISPVSYWAVNLGSAQTPYVTVLEVGYTASAEL